MSRALATVVALGALAAAVTGCGPGGGNTPAQLWLARSADELHAQLVDTGPPAPY